MAKIDIEEEIGKGKLFARTIVEILGKPKAHVEKTVELLIQKAEDTEYMKVLSKEKHPLDKQEGEFWSTFIEFEILFKNFDSLIDYCFEFMPSSIELMQPEKKVYHMNDITNLFNDLMARLHKVDMVAKNLTAQGEVFKTTTNQLLSIIIVLALKNADMTLMELSNYTKVTEDSLKPMLDLAAKAGRVKQKGEKYCLVTL